jgi:hypothetical protein
MNPTTAAVFAAVLLTLRHGHELGDIWAQTHNQALTKGAAGWTGRLADTRHVVTLTVVKLALLATATAVLHLHLAPAGLAGGLSLDAASHWWADRRTTLRRLAERLGKGEFYALGAPREGHDDKPCLGTGAFHLDQAFHGFFLFAAALLIVAL